MRRGLKELLEEYKTCEKLQWFGNGSREAKNEVSRINGNDVKKNSSIIQK